MSNLDEYYTYDALSRLSQMQRGTLNSTKTGIVGTPPWSRTGRCPHPFSGAAVVSAVVEQEVVGKSYRIISMIVSDLKNEKFKCSETI